MKSEAWRAKNTSDVHSFNASSPPRYQVLHTDSGFVNDSSLVKTVTTHCYRISTFSFVPRHGTIHADGPEVLQEILCQGSGVWVRARGSLFGLATANVYK